MLPPPQTLPPGTLTYFHTMAFSLALYFAFPFMQMTCTPLVLRGVGIRTWKAERGEHGNRDCSQGSLCHLTGKKNLPPPRSGQAVWGSSCPHLSPYQGPRDHQLP